MKDDEPEEEPTQSRDRYQPRPYPQSYDDRRRTNYDDWNRDYSTGSRPYGNRYPWYHDRSRNDRFEDYDTRYSRGYDSYYRPRGGYRNYNYDRDHPKSFYPSGQDWDEDWQSYDDTYANQSRQSGDYYNDRRRRGPAPMKNDRHSQGKTRYPSSSNGYQNQRRSRSRSPHPSGHQ